MEIYDASFSGYAGDRINAWLLRPRHGFDGVDFAKRASVPALFSVALMDQVCPPSTVYAAYHGRAQAQAE